ncbi:unnamed protein product [Microthlaspi erraticum]|uniref:Poly [ADP-ribose] polymerase n=1 Tax=Microthlaspi erraticum TaxID=1685480 RepID=A0A6D2HEE8_9BRAS|nr:unnamed protein product [Microthlaspi erraticum]
MMMAAQVEDQEPVTGLDNGEVIDSFSGNTDSGASTILLREDSQEYDVLKKCFLAGMGPLASETTIVAMRKNSPASNRVTTRARFTASRVFTEAMKRKNGGDANVKLGWYSGSKPEIQNILFYGFSISQIQKSQNDVRSHGVGIHLVHHLLSLPAALVCEADEEGIKHLLLCRVILGKPEKIFAGSRQWYPSSREFDSGVDNLQIPRKYVIWSSTMNSYILPSYVVSFKSSRPRGNIRGGGGLGRVRSPCVSFTVLFSLLVKSLDAPRMHAVLRAYEDFRKGKVRRWELIRRMREVVGDELLVGIIKNQSG